jgi:hypothetical protein
MADGGNAQPFELLKTFAVETLIERDFIVVVAHSRPHLPQRYLATPARGAHLSRAAEDSPIATGLTGSISSGRLLRTLPTSTGTVAFASLHCAANCLAKIFGASSLTR